jgi:hypothetical protein
MTLVPFDAARDGIQAYICLYSTAASRHPLPHSGTRAAGKLAAVLLFMKFRPQVPIPARFML